MKDFADMTIWEQIGIVVFTISVVAYGIWMQGRRKSWTGDKRNNKKRHK